MKTVVVEKPVRDIHGVIAALRENDPPFAVVNVGADAQRTYVYLEDYEDKDPTSVVEGWKDVDVLRLSVKAPLGPDDVPEAKADGQEVHEVSVEKFDDDTNEPLDGNEWIVAVATGCAPMRTHMRLKDGRAVLRVGPSPEPGEVVLRVHDAHLKLGAAEVRLRFLPAGAASPEPGAAEALPEGGSGEAQAVLAGGSEAPAESVPPKLTLFQRIFGRKP